MLDASGIIHVEANRYLVAEDEADILRYFVLDKQNHTLTATSETIDLGRHESDFESIAFDSKNQRYYCIGSHGEDYSQRLVSFQLIENTIDSIVELSYDAQLLINEKVDIEALSIWGSHLLIGYRKPNRSKLALVVLYDTETGKQMLTGFDLAGRTFRDWVRIDDQNYLILAGPERGKDYSKLPSCIFWWNGDVFSPDLKMCDISLKGFRAEGIATRQNNDGSIDVLISSDESKVKSAKHFRTLYIEESSISSLLDGAKKPEELSIIF
jgi:hypothetical protein